MQRGGTSPPNNGSSCRGCSRLVPDVLQPLGEAVWPQGAGSDPGASPVGLEF